MARSPDRVSSAVVVAATHLDEPGQGRYLEWLTGYRQEELEAQLDRQTDLETVFADAPQPNPSRALITGVVCGVRVEDEGRP